MHLLIRYREQIGTPDETWRKYVPRERAQILFQMKVIPDSKENLKCSCAIEKGVATYAITRIRNTHSLTEIRSIPLTI